jgi:hypothetical protein
MDSTPLAMPTASLEQSGETAKLRIGAGYLETCVSWKLAPSCTCRNQNQGVQAFRQGSGATAIQSPVLRGMQARVCLP